MLTANLTELELAALSRDVINLSDGHARQSLTLAGRDRVVKAMETLTGGPSDYFEAERRFLDDLSAHSGQEYREGRAFVTYSSSVAMGVVATHLRQRGRPVGVMCPTFDNIPGILRTMDVELVPVGEEYVIPGFDLDCLDALQVGALILVVPNNPTGHCPSPHALCGLMEWAAAKGVLLVLDTAFRWFDRDACWDLIRAADDRGADVISIDDTGKILSFSDVKAAVISPSRQLVASIRAIHTQYVLNVSELALRVLSGMMDPALPDNEVARAHDIVGTNRKYFDAAVNAHLDLIGHDPRMPGRKVALSVEWLSLPGYRDRVVRACRDGGVEVLAGDHFYWADPPRGRGSYLRLALMRDPAVFARGADVVVEAIANHSPAPIEK